MQDDNGGKRCVFQQQGQGGGQNRVHLWLRKHGGDQKGKGEGVIVYVYVGLCVLAVVVVTALFFKVRADDLRGLGDELGMMEGGDADNRN